MASDRTVFVNGYFRGQRITGQQRYATEIANRLLAEDPSRHELRPSATKIKGLTWFELQTALPVRAARGVLVSLTARAPALHRRHVVTVHDLFPLTNPEWYAPMYIRVHGTLLHWQLKHAAAFIAVSDPVRDELRAIIGDRAPIVVAPNAVDLRQFSVPTAPSTGQRYFLAVGSIDPRKNYPTLIAAHKSLPADVRAEHPLLIVGGGASTFADAALEVDEHIQTPGYVSDADLVTLYAGAAAYISVSFGEGFGIPIVEAQAEGARLILSDIATHRWVAQDAATYVDPRSVEDVRSAMLRALTEPLPTPSTSSLAPVRFDWDTSAATISELLNDVAQQL